MNDTKLPQNSGIPSSRVELPSLWAVIYRESLHGHHLLFSHLSVDDALAPTEELEEAVCEVICLNDLSSMIRYIKQLPPKTQRGLFGLYLRSIRQWSSFVKEECN